MFTSTYSNKQNAIARFATTSIASFLVSGAMILTTGCSDDSSSPAGAATDTTYSDDSEAMYFEMGDGTYELNITGEGAWRIVDSTYFVQSFSQTEGNGPATVELTVLSNDLEERLEGKLIIEYDDPTQNKTIKCIQKYSGDYDENAPATTNKKYGVGYGYNAITGGFADKGLMAEIFNTKKLYTDEAISGSETSIDYSERSFTGSTIADISYQLGIKNNVKGNVAKFEAEMKNSYDVGVAAQDTFMFAMNYIDVTTQSVSLDVPLEMIISDDSGEYMKAWAYNAINGLNKSYKTSNEGFKKLIRDYGTHVVLGSNLGARVRQSMKVNVAHISTKFDMKTYAKGAYSGKTVSSENTVENELHASLQANLENTDIKVSVWGGDPQKGMALTNAKIIEPEDLKAWKESIVDTTGSLYLLGFSDGGIVPLYELVDENLEGGKERKQKMKDYMEGKDVIADFSTYECGTVTMIDVPKIVDGYNNTLVKDIYSKGQLIAKAVLEYIPNQNYNEKIMVIYPVINNKVRFNMGFFIGDENHKPARVTWDGTDVAIVEYPEIEFGIATTVYIRGASITTEMPQGTTPFNGYVEDSYLKAKKFTNLMDGDNNVVKNDRDYNYPLVKVFDHIWTREDYMTRFDKKGLALEEITEKDGKQNYADYETKLGEDGSNYILYTFKMFDKDFAPAGWSIPKTETFKQLQDKLEANGIAQLSKAVFSKASCTDNDKMCGILGLNVKPRHNEYDESIPYLYTGYMTGDKGAVMLVEGASAFTYIKAEKDKKITGVSIRLIQN